MNEGNLEPYEIDASGFKGKAIALARPNSVEEIRGIVANNPRIVPRGAGSGLSGGCVPQEDLDLVLDLTNLKKISNFDKDRRTIEVEAGVILVDLLDFLEKTNLTFPVVPASYQIATIGGMIATNAAGSTSGRLERIINWIQWVDVVDCEGRILRKGATEISDYAGMEGITGVIVRACLKLSLQRNYSASLITLDSMEEVLKVTKELKRDQSISKIEFFDKEISSWISLPSGYNLIVEYEGNAGLIKGSEYQNLISKVEQAYFQAFKRKKNRIEDSRVLIDKLERLNLWFEENKIPYFAHFSTGVIHPCFDIDSERLIPEMMKLVRRIGGQVSGSFGIGILKKGFVEANDKKIIENIKKRTDPLNKFNRGKIL